MPRERLLQIAERLRGGEPFDGIDAPSVGLYREHQARTRRDAIDMHGARTAHAMFAADVRARRAELMTQKIGQQLAGFAMAAALAAIERQRDGVLLAVPHDVRCGFAHLASSITRHPSSRTR